MGIKVDEENLGPLVNTLTDSTLRLALISVLHFA